MEDGGIVRVGRKEGRKFVWFWDGESVGLGSKGLKAGGRRELGWDGGWLFEWDGGGSGRERQMRGGEFTNGDDQLLISNYGIRFR